MLSIKFLQHSQVTTVKRLIIRRQEHWLLQFIQSIILTSENEMAGYERTYFHRITLERGKKEKMKTETTVSLQDKTAQTFLPPLTL